MLEIKLTPHLLGFEIVGDYADLAELYDAIWALHFDEQPEEDEPRGSFDEVVMSTRLLALCYDLRHAYQGDRGVALVDNMLGDGKTEWLRFKMGEIPPKSNLVYSVEVLYPELVYEVIVLNYLIEAACAQSVSGASSSGLEGRRPYDRVCIGVVRRFQCKVLQAIRAEASPARYKKILSYVFDNYFAIPKMYQQWLDFANDDWMNHSLTWRKQHLSTVVRDVAEYFLDSDYPNMVEDVERRLRDYRARDLRYQHMTREDFRYKLHEIPEDLVW